MDILCYIGGMIDFIFYLLIHKRLSTYIFHVDTFAVDLLAVFLSGGILFLLLSYNLSSEPVVIYGFGWLVSMIINAIYVGRTKA